MKANLTQEPFLIPTIIIQRDSRLFYNLIKDVPCRLKKYSVCRGKVVVATFVFYMY